MKTNVLRQAALLVTAVLLTTNFWSCSKDEEPVPEPIPPAVAVTGVTLDKTSVSLLVGDSQTLTATVAPKDAANKKVSWKSDKPEIATVDANGKVTGVKAGEATITVYDLTGRIAYDGRATTVSLAAGIYLVRCNGAREGTIF